MTPADSSASRERDTPPAAADHALRWLHATGAEAELLQAVGRRVRQRRRRRLAALSTACVLTLLAGMVWWNRAPQPDVPRVAVATNTATVTAPPRGTLADGSVVELKPGAEIATDFSGAFRRVTLRRGEAHFQVVKDVTRPFIVSAGGVEVRAVGTAFSVQLDAAAVEVLVAEGRVAVEKSVAPAISAPAQTVAAALPLPAPALLDAGHRAVISRELPVAPEIVAIPSEELARRLGWRVPQLEFSRTPLAEVVMLMNRHAKNSAGRRRVVIDPSARGLGELELSGYPAVDNIDGLVRLLEANFKVEVERTGAVIVLRHSR